MKIYYPPYYPRFRCIAAACTDSCCKEWSVAVDPESAAMYRRLPGDLGDRLRQVLTQEDGDTVLAIENGRCPMWRSDGLCRIQAELGHDALCKTCREFPRLTHDFGDFREWGLELSCPEAARMILSAPAAPFLSKEISGGEAGEYDPADMQILLQTRREALALLDKPLPPGEMLALLLIYGYHAQAALDSGEVHNFDACAALEEIRALARPGDSGAVLTFFKELEILSPAWAARLDTPTGSGWDGPYPALARYFIQRYWLQALSDLDLVCRVKLAVISCLLIRLLGGDMTETAQRYSKEIENDPENVDALLDAAYTHPAFTDDKLLGLLLEDAE